MFIARLDHLNDEQRASFFDFVIHPLNRISKTCDFPNQLPLMSRTTPSLSKAMIFELLFSESCGDDKVVWCKNAKVKRLASIGTTRMPHKPALAMALNLILKRTAT